MKLSVSLSDEDVAVLDAYVEQAGLSSRSAGVQRAVQMLRYPALEEEYAQAWEQWSDDEESHAWEPTSGHGIGDATR